MNKKENPFLTALNRIKNKEVTIEKSEHMTLTTSDNLYATEKNKDSLKLNTKSSTNFSTIVKRKIDKSISVPYIGKFSISNQNNIILGFLIIGIFVCVFGFYQIQTNAVKQKKLLETITNLSDNLQKINYSVYTSLYGKLGSYENIFKYSKNANENMKILNSNQNNYNNFYNTIEQKSYDKINKGLVSINKNILVLKENESYIKEKDNIEIKINKDVNFLLELMSKNETNNNYNDIEKILIKIAVIKSDDSTSKYKTEINSLKNIIKIKTIPSELEENIKIFINNMELRISSMVIVENMFKISKKINENVEYIIIDVEKLKTINAENDFGGVFIGKIIILIGFCLIMCSAYLYITLKNFEKDYKRSLEIKENEKNQKSIYKLLTEIMPLQQGDLTKKTTITETLTGAIADSINATVDSLSALVKKIKNTSISMEKKADEAKGIVTEMYSSIEKQTESIMDSGDSVLIISKAIEDIAEKTLTGASVAQNAVRVSEEGSKQVVESIVAMEQINRNIIETVALMKKVSDSSRQISDIVEILSDIAEDTSVLASNATIQAAKAGDAGKGFKIVADSIQQLADKTGSGARSVGALISTVQTDIMEVEKAIKKTTGEVEKGVGLSELAGQSLNRITDVSVLLADIVKTICNLATTNSSISKTVQENMLEILSKAKENKQSAENTVIAISEILNLSNDLEMSVKSFKVD